MNKCTKICKMHNNPSVHSSIVYEQNMLCEDGRKRGPFVNVEIKSGGQAITLPHSRPRPQGRLREELSQTRLWREQRRVCAFYCCMQKPCETHTEVIVSKAALSLHWVKWIKNQITMFNDRSTENIAAYLHISLPDSTLIWQGWCWYNCPPVWGMGAMVS